MRRQHSDLLIAGGRVIDPESGLDAVSDIVIADRRIVTIGGSEDPSDFDRVIDARGLLVLPGLIDLHVHAYFGVNAYSVDVDPFCKNAAVTTAVDAGSSGPINFEGFSQFVASASTTRLLAFVSVAKYGITKGPGDLVNMRLADPKGTARVVSEDPDVAVGIKVRLSSNKVQGTGIDALRAGLEAAEHCGRPLMVHIGATTLSIEEIVKNLRPGDIVTHCFTPQSPSLVSSDGRISSEIVRAYERGVLFDVGHAGGHLGFSIARTCIDQGYAPQILSTDIHGFLADDERPLDLPLVMTKCLALGMSLNDVVAACTVSPARAIGWQDRIGSIGIGREADLTVLRIVEEQTHFKDATGETLTANQSLHARWRIRGGEPYECVPIT